MAIVYGTRVREIEKAVTRLDWDFYFGTVVHRFALLRKMGMPIQVYGKGEQKKPIIALRDVVDSLICAIESDIKPGHKIVNHVTQCSPITRIAEMVGGEVTHIPNPRVEKETHQMVIHNGEFLKFLPARIYTIYHEIGSILSDMDINRLPKNWENIFNGKAHIDNGM